MSYCRSTNNRWSLYMWWDCSSPEREDDPEGDRQLLAISGTEKDLFCIESKTIRDDRAAALAEVVTAVDQTKARTPEEQKALFNDFWGEFGDWPANFVVPDFTDPLEKFLNDIFDEFLLDVKHP